MLNFRKMCKECDWLYAVVVYLLVVCIAVIITLIPILYAIADNVTLAALGYLLRRVMQGASFVAVLAVLALSTTPGWRREQTLFCGNYYAPTKKKRGFLWKRCKDGEL